MNFQKPAFLEIHHCVLSTNWQIKSHTYEHALRCNEINHGYTEPLICSSGHCCVTFDNMIKTMLGDMIHTHNITLNELSHS